MKRSLAKKSKNKQHSVPRFKGVDMKKLIKKYASVDYAKKVVFDPHYVAPICWLLLFGEFFLNVFIIQNVRYTEIDWKAYMQEVEGFLNGTWDYQYLKGDTGPCVYPAGFLYIYSALYYLTSEGVNIVLAQYIFLLFYMLQMYLVYEIYKKTCKIPGYALILSAATSYRIHSIYVLRLFNDPIAVTLFFVSLEMFLNNRWRLGSVFYSLAVSVKMNILLYAPCLLLAYIINLGYKDTAINLIICAVIQVILGAPFLYTNFFSYLKASFDLGRVFEHKWTVNYRFLDRTLFENSYFHIALLILHLALLAAFFPLVKRYLNSYATLRDAIVSMRESSIEEQKKKSKKTAVKEPEPEELTEEQQQFLNSFEKSLAAGDGAKKRAPSKKQQPPKIEEEKEKYTINFNKISQLMVLPFFVTNFIGVVCARSLHYQFYSWYFHSLLYLVHCTPYKKPIMFLLLAIIEFCWNVYPSSDISSLLLHATHVVLLLGVYRTMRV